MIRLDSVSKHYGPLKALQHIELTVRRGETKILLGTSGCGKSTILRLMIGLVSPTSGAIFVEGEPITTPQAWEQLRPRMGYVIQDGGLFPHLTARGNATLMSDHLKWSASRTDARLEELIELTRLPPDALDRYPIELSGGQRQRVSLIRALMLDPDVMLMDEPLGALDPITRADLQTDLKQIFERLHKTVVVVTHDVGEAAYLGDDIVLLRAGRIVQQGPIREFLESPREPFVAQFINAQRNPLLEPESSSPEPTGDIDS